MENSSNEYNFYFLNDRKLIKRQIIPRSNLILVKNWIKKKKIDLRVDFLAGEGRIGAMVRQWRIIYYNGYTDIAHCSMTEHYEPGKECIYYYDPDVGFWRSGRYGTQIKLSNTKLKCETCKELLPNYIKFQALLLAK